TKVPYPGGPRPRRRGARSSRPGTGRLGALAHPRGLSSATRTPPRSDRRSTKRRHTGSGRTRRTPRASDDEGATPSVRDVEPRAFRASRTASPHAQRRKALPLAQTLAIAHEVRVPALEQHDRSKATARRAERDASP